ncbi:hypothetical protein MMC10_004643 [Thelotrema lepadinum]|nr:hypothetical protein [Thelotrema lepadinum]
MAVLSTGDAQYQLFYVDTQNFIRAIPTDHPFLWLNNSLFVASDTRTLSISPLVPAAPSTDVEVGPFYETPGGNIAGLYGSFPGGTGDNNVTWNWTDISGTLYASAANVGAGLGAPFAATISQSTYEGNSTQELQIQAFNPKQFTNSSAPVFCQFMFSWDAPGMIPGLGLSPIVSLRVFRWLIFLKRQIRLQNPPAIMTQSTETEPISYPYLFHQPRRVRRSHMHLRGSSTIP